MPQKIFLKIKITLYKSRAGYVATWSQLSPKSDISRHYSLNEKEGSLKAPCFFGVDFFHALKSNLSESRSFKINLLELLHLIKVIPMFLCQGFTTVENHCNGYRLAFLCSVGFLIESPFFKKCEKSLFLNKVLSFECLNLKHLKSEKVNEHWFRWVSCPIIL